MRNFLLAALAAVVLCGAGLTGALGQDRGVMVKNESSFTAVRIFIMPSGRDCCWSRDLLEEIVIPPGPKTVAKKKSKSAPENYVPINFDDGSRNCVYDIRVTTPFPGWEWLFKQVNVCVAEEIILKGDLARSNDGNKRKITIKNESRLAARNIYIIPDGEDCCWSPDLLPVAEIPKLVGRYAVDLDNGKNTCVYDIRITSEKKGIDWYLDRVDVCNLPDDDKHAITLKTRPFDGKRRLVTVKNESQQDASRAFTIPVGESCCWSNDLLGGRLIPKGKSLLVDFDDETGKCLYYYRITRSDNGMEWYGMVDVCSEESKGIPALLLP